MDVSRLENVCRYLGLPYRSVANHRSEYNNGFQEDCPRSINLVLFFIFDRRRERNKVKSIKNKISSVIKTFVILKTSAIWTTTLFPEMFIIY